MDGFTFDIDLEAELQKIAQRQHLNDVHHVVQLVRHALQHDPSVIRITSTRQRLCILQDGRAFDDSERTLLETVVAGEDLLKRQDALGVLEQEHGITMLSVLLSFPRVVVTSGTWGMVALEGVVRREAYSSEIPGYRIEILRTASRRRIERRELEFFCAGLSVPLFYNGSKLNRPLTLQGQACTVAMTLDGGLGELGIAPRGELSAMSYLKRGVRFGFRRFLDPHGIPLEGYWNSSYRGFEPAYERSIGAGDEFMLEAKEALYHEAAGLFQTLDPGQKERLRKTGLTLVSHRREWREVPLFDSVRQEFTFSFTYLENLERRFGTIPCSLRFSRRLPAWLPRLSLEHMQALRRMGHEPTLLPVPTGLRWRGLKARLRLLICNAGVNSGGL